MSDNTEVADEKKLKKRSSKHVITWGVCTLGGYLIYWVPSVAMDINKISKEEKYDFWKVCFTLLATCSLAALFYPVFFAKDLKQLPEVPETKNLVKHTILMCVLAIFAAFLTMGLGLMLGAVVEIYMCWLIQDRINDYIDTLEADGVTE